jgi:hypothetical protein
VMDYVDSKVAQLQGSGTRRKKTTKPAMMPMYQVQGSGLQPIGAQYRAGRGIYPIGQSGNGMRYYA